MSIDENPDHYPLPLGRVRKTDADSGPCFKTNWP